MDFKLLLLICCILYKSLQKTYQEGELETHPVVQIYHDGVLKPISDQGMTNDMADMMCRDIKGQKYNHIYYRSSVPCRNAEAYKLNDNQMDGAWWIDLAHNNINCTLSQAKSFSDCLNINEFSEWGTQSDQSTNDSCLSLSCGERDGWEAESVIQDAQNFIQIENGEEQGYLCVDQPTTQEENNFLCRIMNNDLKNYKTSLSSVNCPTSSPDLLNNSFQYRCYNIDGNENNQECVLHQTNGDCTKCGKINCQLDNDNNSTATKAAVGGSVGTVLILIFVAVYYLFWYAKIKKREKEKKDKQEEKEKKQKELLEQNEQKEKDRQQKIDQEIQLEKQQKIIDDQQKVLAQQNEQLILQI